jgi:DNA-directed RNA polymerase subunit K/omega
MGSTIPLDELEKYAENVYEAIIMIAKRADEINKVQKKMLEAEVENNMPFSEEEDEDEAFVTDLVDRQYLKLPKPTTIALQEMLEGKLKKEQPEE